MHQRPLVRCTTRTTPTGACSRDARAGAMRTNGPTMPIAWRPQPNCRHGPRIRKPCRTTSSRPPWSRRSFLAKASGVDSSRPWASAPPCRPSRACCRSVRCRRWRRRKAERSRKPDLKIGFIAITCATPLIMADPLGFYRKQGLNVTLMKTAGWALIRDRMLNRELDATHFLSPMPIAISMGAGSVAQPMRVATIQNINGQANHARDQAQEQPRPEELEGLQVRDPVRILDAQLPAALLPCGGGHQSGHRRAAARRAAARDGRQPAGRQHRRLPRSGPDQPAGRVRRGRLHPHPVEGHLGRSSVLRVRRVRGVHPAEPQHVRGAVPLGAHGVRDGARGEEPRVDREGDRARRLSQPARGRRHAGAHRQVRRRARQRGQRARPRGLRSGPVVFDGRVDAHADEALGAM